VGLIKNLQKKPERERKIILWAVLSVVALFFIVLWFSISSKSFNNLKGLKMEDISPSENRPELIEEPFEETVEDLEDLKELLEELENEEENSTN